METEVYIKEQAWKIYKNSDSKSLEAFNDKYIKLPFSTFKKILCQKNRPGRHLSENVLWIKNKLGIKIDHLDDPVIVSRKDKENDRGPFREVLRYEMGVITGPILTKFRRRGTAIKIESGVSNASVQAEVYIHSYDKTVGKIVETTFGKTNDNVYTIEYLFDPKGDIVNIHLKAEVEQRNIPIIYKALYQIRDGKEYHVVTHSAELAPEASNKNYKPNRDLAANKLVMRIYPRNLYEYSDDLAEKLKHENIHI